MKINDINHPSNLWAFPLEDRLHILYSLAAEAEDLGMDSQTATGWRWVIRELITVAEQMTAYQSKK